MNIRPLNNVIASLDYSTRWDVVPWRGPLPLELNRDLQQCNIE